MQISSPPLIHAVASVCYFIAWHDYLNLFLEHCTPVEVQHGAGAPVCSHRRHLNHYWLFYSLMHLCKLLLCFHSNPWHPERAGVSSPELSECGSGSPNTVLGCQTRLCRLCQSCKPLPHLSLHSVTPLHELPVVCVCVNWRILPVVHVLTNVFYPWYMCMW